MKQTQRLGLGALLVCAFSAAQAQTYIVPQIADGGGWQTGLVLTNTTTSPATAALTCFKDSGGATDNWSLSFQETSSTSSLALRAAGTLFLHTYGTAATTSVGWCQLKADSGVQAYAIFTASSATATQDGTALAAQANSRVLVPFDNVSGLTTSIAIVNPDSSSEVVSVSIQTADGTVTKSSLGTLPGNGHMAFELPGKFPVTAGKRGLIEFFSSTGTLSALALRFNASGAFTSAPVYADSGSPIIGASSGSTPVTAKSLTLSATSVAASGTVTGTVTLSAAAPTGGAVVSLSSSNRLAATVPTSVTVAAGATTATFTVSAAALSTAQTTTLTASYGGSSAAASLSVTAAASSSTSWFSQLTISGTLQPVGYDSGSFAMRIARSDGNATYANMTTITGSLIGAIYLSNGTATDGAMTLSFPSASSSVTHIVKVGGSWLTISGASFRVKLAAPDTDYGYRVGKAAGTFTFTGTPYLGGGASVTVSGTFTGTYSGAVL
jgi:hypothetical protein